MNFLKKTLMGLALSSTLMMGACASTQDQYGDVYDPYEPYNRAVFSFNEGVDYVLLDPLTDGYRFVVPEAFRMAISNFLTNIKSPLYIINELLQGDLDGAGTVTKRFVFNTFTGFGGIVDTASWEGITYEPEDFGQTLAVWGVESGGYVVMPFFGPSTVRDSVGFVVDMFLDPVNWYLWSEHKDDLDMALTGATIIDTKDRFIDLQRDLKKNSLDYYAATRSVWSQRREALINDGNIYDYGEFE